VRYLALGDSISIDDYTGVDGGGAASQLARLLEADEFVDLTRDGHTAEGVFADLRRRLGAPDVVTLTAGGNDLLQGRPAREVLHRLDAIGDRLESLGGRVVLNTVYDPSDGDDELGRRELGLPPVAIRALRVELDALNDGIRRIAAGRRFLLADLLELYRGHGLAAAEPWFAAAIEPNLAGATATAELWHRLLRAG
jgi:hypothetical protein